MSDAKQIMLFDHIADLTSRKFEYQQNAQLTVNDDTDNLAIKASVNSTSLDLDIPACTTALTSFLTPPTPNDDTNASVMQKQHTTVSVALDATVSLNNVKIGRRHTEPTQWWPC